MFKIKNKLLLKYHFLILIIIFFLVFRIDLLQTHFQFSCGEEGIVGLMSKHIFTNSEFPLYFYGQAYNGGGALESYIFAPFYSFYGNDIQYLRIIILFFSFLSLISLYYFMKTEFSILAANIAALFFIFSPGIFLSINFLALGGYIESLFIIILSLILFYKTINEPNKKSYYFLLGILFGFGIWIQFFIIPIILTIYFFNFLKNKRFFLSFNFIFSIYGLTIGLIPFLFYGIKNCFRNLLHFFYGTIFEKPIILILNFFTQKCSFEISQSSDVFLMLNTKKFIISFMSFFGGSIISRFITFMTIILLFGIIIFFRNDLIKIFKSSYSKNYNNLLFNSVSKISILLVFLIIYLFILFIKGNVRERYFFIPFMFIILIFSAFFSKLLKEKSYLFKKRYKVVIIIIIILFLIYGFTEFVSLKKTSNNGLNELVNFLDKNDIHFVYANYYLKWGIIFNSNEKIIASCENFGICDYRYIFYEDVVKKSNTSNFIFIENSTFEKRFINFINKNNIQYNKQSFNIDIYNIQLQTKYLDLNTINIYFDPNQKTNPYLFSKNLTWEESFI